MLESLDEFEEHPYIYEREPVSVEFEITNRELKGESKCNTVADGFCALYIMLCVDFGRNGLFS
jgi:hypothetical protein